MYVQTLSHLDISVSNNSECFRYHNYWLSCFPRTNIIVWKMHVKCMLFSCCIYSHALILFLRWTSEHFSVTDARILDTVLRNTDDFCLWETRCCYPMVSFQLQCCFCFFSNRFDNNSMRTTAIPHTPRDLNATATHVTLRVHYLDLTIFNKGAYLTFKLIFHKALNLF